jgi:peptide/nickel transport system permease protein
MDVSRVIEADARATLGRPFVEAASAAGSGRIRLAIRHVLPIAAPVLAAIVPVVVAEAVLLEATLAYLGVGASPSSWGTMVAEGQRMLSTTWWMAVVPGALVVLTALAVHGPVTARSRPATPVPW